MKIVQSILTENPFYTAGNKITVKGFMLHSVGCPQPNASVFVKNWNKSTYTRACVHAFIDGNTGDVYQTLPWNYRGGHAGGTANDTHIGVEMCEPACIKYTSGANFTCSDIQTAKAVVTRTYESAVELFAQLCKQYNLDPLADGVIISHKEGGARGVASNHADPTHLWTGLKMNYTMDTFRKAVKAKMNASSVLHRVQVGAFRNEKYAEAYLAEIKKAGFAGAFIVKEGGKDVAEKSVSMPILKKGSKGDDVENLQRILNALGYTDSSKKALTVDGSFGNATLYALSLFQKAKGLTVDGCCGEKTWTALRKAVLDLFN